jgi:hypothetical protein
MVRVNFEPYKTHKAYKREPLKREEGISEKEKGAYVTVK